MKKIGFIGAGNVCWHLVKIFAENGLDCQIFSRNPEKTQKNFADIQSPFSIKSIDDKDLKIMRFGLYYCRRLTNRSHS